ncbi:MAG: ABC transporter permease [Candidatus Latescibacterota bacterium]
MLRQCFLLALKMALRRPFHTFASLFGTSLAVGLVVAAAASVSARLGPVPPEVNRDRTLSVSWAIASLGDDPGSMHFWPVFGLSYRFLDQHVRHLRTPEKVCLYSSHVQVTTYTGGDKAKLELTYVDGAYWQILAFHFLEGRPFTEEEDRSGQALAVFSRRTRQRLFGDGPALGRIVDLDGAQLAVVGVVDDVPRRDSSGWSEVWAPVGAGPADLREGDGVGGPFSALLLARRRADFPRVRQEYAAVVARVQRTERCGPEQLPCDRLTSAAETPFEAAARGYRYPIRYAYGRLLFGWVGLALLLMALPALNMVNLNLARVTERSAEIGVRKAFGARSHALLVQFLVEHLLVTLVGGALGIALALRFLPGGSGPFPFPRLSLLSGPGLAVVLAGTTATLVFALLSGLYPAWRMARLRPAETLRGGRRP